MVEIMNQSVVAIVDVLEHAIIDTELFVPPDPGRLTI